MCGRGGDEGERKKIGGRGKAKGRGGGGIEVAGRNGLRRTEKGGGC